MPSRCLPEVTEPLTWQARGWSPGCLAVALRPSIAPHHTASFQSTPLFECHIHFCGLNHHHVLPASPPAHLLTEPQKQCITAIGIWKACGHIKCSPFSSFNHQPRVPTSSEIRPYPPPSTAGARTSLSLSLSLARWCLLALPTAKLQYRCWPSPQETGHSLSSNNGPTTPLP